MSERPDAPLAALEIIEPGERRQVVETFNATDRPLPQSPATLPELGEAQAARSPGATALVCGDETLGYGELEARANRLARHLAAAGIGPESVVALAIGRSPDMVVALLAVLKAGAAYLPLDPD